MLERAALMNIEKYLLPAGIGFAALVVLLIVTIVLRARRSREQDKMSAEDRERLAEERRKTWRRRLAVTSLGIAFAIILCIAGIAAWLSFGAQKAYAFDRNGGSWDAATGFALLLDAGALGLSLLRLFEALTARSSQLTRFYLVAFIVASATMNLLHAPSPSLGGRLVAVIPPLVYAVFLETLLKKVEQLVLGKYPKRKRRDTERGYSLLLWVPFVGYPRQMWKRWREDLHDTLDNVRAPGSRKPLAAAATMDLTPGEDEGPAPDESPKAIPAPSALRQAAPSASPPAAPLGAEPRPTQQPAYAPAAAVPAPRASSAPGPAAEGRPAPSPSAAGSATPRPSASAAPSGERSKKDQLRDALVDQVRAGDLTVLSNTPQIANGAAYKANQALGRAAGEGRDHRGNQKGLMAEGAVRAALKGLLPELRRIAAEVEQVNPRAAEPAPDHQRQTQDEPPHERPRDSEQEQAFPRGAESEVEEPQHAAMT
ncbi:DUF2637 domain-containing protein [Streptomyces bauhiniae]|uniref:DUF2637 domain-containing protein n=1 Tax=Streptomyces bauhiniae TaxID=2340725 RepID=A0A4Z1CTT2_9ACTN|nr:DUF2637 domain-containing protein [Streptomyces bauhiniae]TGN72266.1 DUF2637 domain-containing protein [Streptomyces bauhiniae]